jgi:peptidoglycan/LPS O-acetylase OafA/YrhL
LKLTFKSITSKSPGYRADIDGLRAIAVLCVVFYHLGSPRFPGGFVGVDIFLVVSGYLITQVIQGGIERGEFSFLSFYDRRIRRILPALVAIALATSAVAVLIFPPTGLLNFGKSLLATACFAANFYFAHADQSDGYFGNSSPSQPLLHMWSLSLEEQFYIFHPVLLLLLNKRVKKRYMSVILLVCIALSFAICLWGTKHQRVNAFYLLPARAWELLIGAFLALSPLPRLSSRLVREIAAVAGIATISYAVLEFSIATPFPGFNALLPCAGAWLILYAGESGSSLVGSALSLRPVVFIGVISYSLYLWHWPLIVFIRFITARSYFTRREACFALALSLVLAFLSFEFVESPFRRNPARFKPKRTVWAACAASAALASLAIALIVSHGLPNRFDSRTREILAENEARKQEWPIPEPCTNYRTPLHRYSDVVFCEIQHSSRNVLFLGDSHIEQLYPVVQQLQPQLNGEGVVFATASGCPLTEHLNNAIPGYYCDAFNRFAMRRALSSDIDTVFIGFFPWWVWSFGQTCQSVDSRCINGVSPDQAEHQVIHDLSSEIRALRASGKRVIVALPFPRFDMQIPDFEIAAAITGERWAGGYPVETSSVRIREELQDVAKQTGSDIYDPKESLCDANRCIYQVNGISLYMDEDHLAASQVGILRQSLLKVLVQAH